ncbi:uncharacterized protein PF3D7_1120000 [Onthophagus taurus]|uniref:uncharacterized protein PF3D7_1120000 n=1 Tax=Onthophagus taurus TaxID=166361 RepID=UPI000C1FD894|nr:uncharacterized protein LOC111418870 [Onthophagus taurus]
MKSYNLRVKKQQTLETKRVPLKDYTNVISARSRGNVSKTAEKDNSCSQCYMRRRKSGKNHYQSQTKQVLDDIRQRKCQVVLDKDKSIENKIIKMIGNKTIQKDDKNEKNYGNLCSDTTKDTQQRVHAPKPCQVILKRDKSIERNVIKTFGIKIMQEDDNVTNKNRNKMMGSSNTNKFIQKSVETLNEPKENKKNRNLRQTNLSDFPTKRQKGDFKQKVGSSDNKGVHRNLRKRNSKQNFAEESLKELQDEPKSTNDNSIDKRPIYRRMSQFKEPKGKKKNDVYAFDFSLENDTKSPSKRKKKKGHSLNTSLPFERYMKEMVRKLDEKHDKEMGKNKKGNVKKAEINNKPKVKINRKDKKIKNVKNKNITTEIVLSNLSNNQKESAKSPEIDKIKIISSIKIVPLISKNIGNEKQFTSTPLHERYSSPNIFESENNEEYEPTTDFDQISLNKTPNINRFQQLNTPMSPIVDKTNSVEASPWRFNVEVRRNPHFLQYKRSLLPNYNQDMVLDSTLIEKRSFSKSTSDFNVRPIPKQTSILKYVSGGKNLENFDSMNSMHHSSLFDAHDFISPERKRSLENKENKIIGKNVNVAKRNIFDISNNSNSFEENINFVTKRLPKRNILGPKIDNEKNINNISEIDGEENLNESSLNSSSSQSKSDFFGFNVSEITHQSNQNTPRRMEDIIKKLIKEKKKVCFVVNETKKNKISSDIEVDDDNAEKKLEEIGFFDYQDKEPERNFDLDMIKQYKRRHGKRRRSPSRSGTESEDDEECTRKRRKKKNERTKAEEAAAEKWYSEFNKMCDEVDKFPLEIEKVK